MKCEEIRDRIEDAEMILVGLGSEFCDSARLRENAEFVRGRELLKEAGYYWLIPAWNEYCSAKMEDIVSPALGKLTDILEGKNYFVVSTATDQRVCAAPWREGRLVMPCGTVAHKQCVRGCPDVLEEVSGKEKKELEEFFRRLYTGVFAQEAVPRLGRCPKCGSGMVLNTAFAEGYDESGYLEQWQIYTRWLQGTLNRRLLVLELGVGMRFPTAIRWPFEKVAFFNNKASFVRVNEKLYQLSEELAVKGCSVAQNAIAWLETL